MILNQQATIQGYEPLVLHSGMIGPEFDVDSGVKQDCVLMRINLPLQTRTAVRSAVLYVGNEVIEEVDKFVYLDSIPKRSVLLTTTYSIGFDWPV